MEITMNIFILLVLIGLTCFTMVQVYNNINIGSILRSLRTPREDDAHLYEEDRTYLLLLMARSFASANKLLYEKKHPNSPQIILVFQLKNGNVRFSLNEADLPISLHPTRVSINTDRINFKNNYRLIKELIQDSRSDA